MMASTDFSTSTALKMKPAKKTMRDSQPQNKQPQPSQPLPKFEPSQKSHAWASGAQTFTGLFNQGGPVAPVAPGPQAVAGPGAQAPVGPPGTGSGDEAIDKQNKKYDGGKLPAW